ncbi:hypothetical protein IWQ62_004132 [Dispira parvispora]|uniref:F-box domain-containing protein n=1 Tax=Dispira parvispora TaxID=1520584 RepID=A0A9W8ATH3_9FUNG|nr:hypothetical protein IWQ62_004132 [Dispira parvispora]
MTRNRRPGRHSLGLGFNTLNLGRSLGLRRQSQPVEPLSNLADSESIPASAVAAVPETTPRPPTLETTQERSIGSMRLLGVRHASLPIPTNATLEPEHTSEETQPNLSPQQVDSQRTSSTLSVAPDADSVTTPALVLGPLAKEAPPRRRFRSLTPRGITSLSNITRRITSLSPEKSATTTTASITRRRRSHEPHTVYPVTLAPEDSPVPPSSSNPHFRVIHHSTRFNEDTNVGDSHWETFTEGATPGESPAPAYNHVNQPLGEITSASPAGVLPTTVSSSGSWRAIATLPREILYRILSYVESPKDLVVCSQVCNTWRFPALVTYRNIMRIYPYANMSLLRALRKRLRKHRGPSTMKTLDDIIYDLSEEYYRGNPDLKAKFHPDDPIRAIYFLLWTFLYIDREFRNPAVKPKVSCEYFIKLVQRNYQKFYTSATLKNIYKDIKHLPILECHEPIVMSPVSVHPQDPDQSEVNEPEAETDEPDREVQQRLENEAEISRDESVASTSVQNEAVTSPSHRLSNSELPEESMTPAEELLLLHEEAPLDTQDSVTEGVGDSGEELYQSLYTTIEHFAELDVNVDLGQADPSAWKSDENQRHSQRVAWSQRLRVMSLTNAEPSFHAIRGWWTHVLGTGRRVARPTA